MKYRLQKSILCLLILTSFLVAEQPSLVILTFEADGVSPEEALIFSDHVQAEFVVRDDFAILEKPEIESDCYSEECLIKAGRRVNSDFVIGGRLSKSENQYVREYQ